MRFRFFAVLVVLFFVSSIFLSSCSIEGGSPVGGSDPASENSTETQSDLATAVNADETESAVTFRVAGEDGSAVAGADVYLVSSFLDRQIRTVTDADGIASPEDVDAGIWFVRVSKNGYRTWENSLEVTSGANSADIPLIAATKLPRYLLSYSFQISADGPSMIGLAGSEDGVAFTSFPGWKAIEGVGGGVVILDGYLCVYANNSVIRYDLDTGVWEEPQPYYVYSEAGLQNAEQDFFGPLMRDVRFFMDPTEGVVAIGGDMEPRYDYADFFEESLANQLISVTGWQTPLADAGGLLLLRPANTWMTGGLVNDNVDRDTSFVLLSAPDGGRYLLTTTANGLRLLHGSALGDEFAPTDVLPDSYMYKGKIAGVTGLSDEEQGGYVLYGVREASEKQLYRASLASFDKPFDVANGLVSVDMDFLDPRAVSFENPVILDTSQMSSEQISDTAGLQRATLALGFGENEYLFFPMTSAASGVISYNSMQEGDRCTAEISSDMTLVTACDTYTPSDFVVSGLAPAGSNIESAGLVYAWNPSGSLPGGFAFTISEGTWKLSALVPETYSSQTAGSKIITDRTFLEGEFKGDPSKAVLTVSFRDGHHILMIDGEVVGECETPADPELLHAGYVGLIATSGKETGEATFTYEAPNLLVR